MKLFPHGPWKHVAAIVKTPTERQLRTHAQKYRAKLARQQQKIMQRGLLASQKERRPQESPWERLKKTKIKPIKFTNTTVQYDDCFEFLLDAFRDDLLALGLKLPPKPNHIADPRPFQLSKQVERERATTLRQ
ncbi:hypothetical protein AC1031_020705 [Aphanomyces cochlioides]|nr:hypothetical protein AC1031_020705 [Aphanomyces cochlioides]